jgi:sugar lactone lactonase YvrE/thiol-disulfide isomerase/thioredoxin
VNARVAAPELASALEWVNTDEPPSLSAMRGRVVLLNFWSFDSVNCINLLPDIRYLENKYHDGLSVVGIHTPKYEYQRQAAPVLKAVNRNHIRHPVANDPGYVTWQAYGVQSWPTMALIDAQGQLAALLPGEGRRDEADAMVGHLLEEAAKQDLRVYESQVSSVRAEPRQPLRFPTRVLITDASLWIADTGHNRILECNHEGRVVRQFGSGNPGFWDGSNVDAGFSAPQGMALARDSLFVADTGNHALRRVRLTDGEVKTVAGTGGLGHDIPHEYVEPTKIAMSAPSDVAAVGDSLYLAVSGQNQVWQFNLNTNKLVALAGSGKLALEDGAGVGASFAQPIALSVIGQQLIIVDSAASAIRALRLLDNRVTTFIGKGLYEFGDAPGKPEDARLQNPLAACVDARGLVFIADSYNAKIKALNLRTTEVRALNLRYTLQEPAGIALGANALWISNTNAHEVVRVDLSSGEIKRLTITE